MELSLMILTFFAVVLVSTPKNLSMGNAFCNPIERKALTKFKHDLNDPSNHLSNWFGKDCCKWNGVICNNRTETNVVQLQLGDFSLSGELNPSLLELKYLNYFNLSLNSFDGTGIPPFLGSLQHLRILDISQAGFTGKVPPQLGNLSHLYHLDISSMWKVSSISALLEVDDLEWLSHLSSLEYLDLSYVNLTSDYWPHLINMLPSLIELRLSNCELNSMPPLSLVNFTSLAILDLSSNYFNSSLSEWLYNLTNLVTLDIHLNQIRGQISTTIANLNSIVNLDLSWNELEGEIPRTLGYLCNLEILDLSNNKLQGEISGFLGNSSGCLASKLKSLELQYNLLSGQLPDQLGSLKNLEIVKLTKNSFSGSIPTSLGRLSLLRVLDLEHNKFNGSLPESLWHLSNLEALVISDNMPEGDVTEAHLTNLKKLETLYISSMVLNVSLDWVPPFQLRYLLLQNCSIGHRFPEWLRTQKDLVEVEISNAGISGSVPSWFWNMTSQLDFLNISHNQLEGDLSNVLLTTEYGGTIYLNSNWFTGNLPLVSSHVLTLDLSRNSFSGPISVLLCRPIEHQNYLVFLDLSKNLLSGELPDCWFYWTSLVLISLESNNITGNIPSSIGFLLKLQTLRLQNNSLSGGLPVSLQNCTKLRIIDLGENRLLGRIPTWIGESLKELIIMRLHSNMFYSEIPRELCYLTMLQIMDMGHNNLSGSIPICFSNFSKMGSEFYPNIGRYNYMSDTKDLKIYASTYLYTEMKLVVKGKEWIYGDILLNLFAAMDLSNNNLHGEIPEEVTYLFRLQRLNLANNSLSGRIPNKIGLLSSLETLDLSNNRLSGSIPRSTVNLTFLGYFNLSYNNLSGEIPLSTQLQSFSELSYIGNHNLCGRPLRNCNEDEKQSRKAPNGDGEGIMDGEEGWIEMKWFYMGLPLGFVVGFWCLWGVLLVNKSWRYAYFRFLDEIIYSLCTCLEQKKKLNSCQIHVSYDTKMY